MRTPVVTSGLAYPRDRAKSHLVINIGRIGRGAGTGGNMSHVLAGTEHGSPGLCPLCLTENFL